EFSVLSSQLCFCECPSENRHTRRILLQEQPAVKLPEPASPSCSGFCFLCTSGQKWALPTGLRRTRKERRCGAATLGPSLLCFSSRGSSAGAELPQRFFCI